MSIPHRRVQGRDQGQPLHLRRGHLRDHGAVRVQDREDHLHQDEQGRLPRLHPPQGQRRLRQQDLQILLQRHRGEEKIQMLGMLQIKSNFASDHFAAPLQGIRHSLPERYDHLTFRTWSRIRANNIGTG